MSDVGDLAGGHNVVDLTGHNEEESETGAVSLIAWEDSKDIQPSKIVTMTIGFSSSLCTTTGSDYQAGHIVCRLGTHHGLENLTLTLAILYWKCLSSEYFEFPLTIQYKHMYENTSANIRLDLELHL